MTSPYTSAGFDNLKKYADSRSIDFNNPSVKEENGHISSVVSKAMNHIKDLFCAFKARISTSIGKFQLARQQEIASLALEPNSPHFNFIVRSSKTEYKDWLEIERALDQEKVKKKPEPIYIDGSGKLCRSENSAFSIIFSPETKTFILAPGSNTDHQFKVQSPIHQPSFNDLPPSESFVITDENNKEVLSISVYIDSEVPETEEKEPNNQNCLSDAANKIKNLFRSIGTHISASIEEFQIARQQERVRRLAERSDLKVKVGVLGRNSDIILEDTLDIQEALLHASFSKTPQMIYIDGAGKLCNHENFVLGIQISPEGICAYKGKEFTDFHLEYSRPKGMPFTDQYISLFDKNKNLIVYIHIFPFQGYERFKQTIKQTNLKKQLALETALLEMRKTNQGLESKTFFINSNGCCDKENATASIFYDHHTQNFTVNPIEGETTDLKLNGEPIKGRKNIPFRDGDNIFTSDKYSLGFKAHIPLVTEAKIKSQRSDRFFEALTELRDKKASARIYIDDNGDLCNLKENAVIEIIHQDRATFIAQPTPEKISSHWEINGRSLEGPISFNMRQPTSFTRWEQSIFSINEQSMIPLPRGDENNFLSYT